MTKKCMHIVSLFIKGCDHRIKKVNFLVKEISDVRLISKYINESFIIRLI